MQHSSGLLFHPDVDLPSDGEDDDDSYMDSATSSGSSLVSPDSSDFTMQTGTGAESARTGSKLGGEVSVIYPHDSVSQRGPGSIISETPSVKPLNDDSHLYRTVHGRAFSSQNDSYMLPADGAELSRHDAQHRLLTLNINSLYLPIPLVHRALAPTPHYQAPGILDIGTGSGRWIADMAKEFPHAECVGLDLVPPNITSLGGVPSNCRFEIDDANLPLSHYTNCFNVVHGRAIEAGISDFESFLYNVAQTLRPDGVLLLVAGSAQFYDPWKRPLQVLEEGQDGFTWLQRLWAATYTAYKKRTASIDATMYWHGWLESNPNYTNVVTQDIFIPVGPWPQGMDERQTYVAELMRYDIIHVSDAYKPLLITDGFPQEVADHWVASSQQELRDLGVHAFVRWRYTTAVRTHAEWQERLEEPAPLELPHMIPGNMPDPSALGSGSKTTR